MPPIRYYNQTAPFWDFVASLEQQGASHPFFNNNNEGPSNTEDRNDQSGPSRQPEPFWGAWGPFAYRGRHERPSGDEETSQPQAAEENPEQEHNADTPQNEKGPASGPHHHHHGPRGHHRGRGRGEHFGRGRGQCGGRGFRGHRGFFPYGVGSFDQLAEAFQSQLFGEGPSRETSDDFTPDVDVFDTAESFVVDVSLPGAKKEDIGVSWNPEKSELSIAGVLHRHGDEELLLALSMSERKVGAFERTVRLGSRANPASIDSDAITARMEDGVLRIDVPKLDSGYVEIKKVDVA